MDLWSSEDRNSNFFVGIWGMYRLIEPSRRRSGLKYHQYVGDTLNLKCLTKEWEKVSGLWRVWAMPVFSTYLLLPWSLLWRGVTCCSKAQASGMWTVILSLWQSIWQKQCERRRFLFCFCLIISELFSPSWQGAQGSRDGWGHVRGSMWLSHCSCRQDSQN